ncbi:glycerol-3-phosphate 1-O-acyltransferase PlsY [candidate division WOR-3 bacterium]|nr:glycerol-3-phosphate 1-O-acyltransferase PlsY [candidate division WOR-3 bacterium]
MNASVPALGLSFLVGALSGSVPFGLFAGRLAGTDIRQRGSGNIGFTNVQRTVGWKWAVPVLMLDIAKGIAPVFAASRLGLEPVAAGLGAVLGHVFTPWLGFRGGKGVATTFGVAAILCPRSFWPDLGLYLLLLLLTGFVSVSSLSFAATLPLLTAVFYAGHLSLLVFALVVSVVIVLRHVANIRRLAARTEPRLGLWVRLFRKR